MVCAIAQKDVTSVSTNGALTFGKYVSIWGTTADTLKNAASKTFTFRVKGEETFNINCQLYSDYVSGTAGGKLKAYTSIDGVNFVVKDSITVTSLTADALNPTVISMTSTMSPYLKLIYTQSGTAVTVPKLYFVTRKN